MSYPFLKQGDVLPAVGVLQKLLKRTGHDVSVDGVYGDTTRRAVREFQKERGLSADGEAGTDTWKRLVYGAERVEILDCIDVFDWSIAQFEVADLVAAGGNPIIIGGMSGGVEQAIDDICGHGGRGNVFLLRFHGHGTAGRVGLSSGKGDEVELGHHTDLTKAVPGVLVAEFMRLRQIFGPYGCVQFMHCSPGKGREGREFLTAISSALDVPVSGGKGIQQGGGPSTMRFEGAVRTVIPNGATLKSWCQKLPDFIPMTVP